jgi:hypothetical protein
MAKLLNTSAPQQEAFPSAPAQKRKFDPIPEGEIVDVEVVEVEIRDLDSEFRAKYKIKEDKEVSFRFKVISGQYSNRNLWGHAKPYWDNSDNCRLRLWTQELFGVDRMPDDYEFDTDDFTGKTARVVVRNYKKRDGSTGDGVQDVLRSLRPSAGAGVPTTTRYEEPF